MQKGMQRPGCAKHVASSHAQAERQEMQTRLNRHISIDRPESWHYAVQQHQQPGRRQLIMHGGLQGVPEKPLQQVQVAGSGSCCTAAQDVT